MNEQKTYGKDEVVDQLEALIGMISNLGNGIGEKVASGIPEGDTGMSTRIREKVTIDGKMKWISGYSMQELFDNYIKLMVREGKIEMVDENSQMPMFGDYMQAFYATYKQDQQKNTVVNRERIIRNHVLPKFGKKRIDRIQTMDLQQFFNSIGKKYAKETAMKVRNIMSPVFDSAVEDELITRNPFMSRRLEITGKDTIHHKAISKDKFDKIKMEVGTMAWREKALGGLLCYTGMRFEEVLGVKWEDISEEWITVRRAVVHPNRNLPEIKCPKTKTSERKIPLHEDLKVILDSFEGKKVGFLLFPTDDPKHKSPLSYSEARRSFNKIRIKFGLSGYTAHDFRDTCATVWRENGIPLDVIARLLGHSKTETTEKRYVKYREEILEEAKVKM